MLSDRYRLGEPLGRGGMADVVAGFDERLRRDVAVKLLRPELAARADVRARFEAEARSAAKLVHPHVVAVFDSGEHEGTPFLIMERLSGETLADHIDGPSTDPAWVAGVGADVLAALSAAHAAGVIHRDVKPGNVLLDAQGRAKVADFGIAKSLEDFDDVTATSHVLGTPAYIAPERLEGATAAPAADIYGVGVTLYEALSGHKPFRGDTAVAVSVAVRTGDAVPLSEARPGLPPALVAVVERAMARDPARRFASADAMATALAASVATSALPANDETVAMDTSATQMLPVADASFQDSTADAPASIATSSAVQAPPQRKGRFGLGQSVVLVAGALLVAAVLGMVFMVRNQVPLHERIRSVAADIGLADGFAGPALAEGLREVADRVEVGAGAAEADGVLRDLGAWRQDRAIGDEARLAAVGVLRDVPGVNDQAIRAATAATVPPLTAPQATDPPPPETTAAPRTTVATTTTTPERTTTTVTAATSTTSPTTTTARGGNDDKGKEDDERGKGKDDD